MRSFTALSMLFWTALGAKNCPEGAEAAFAEGAKAAVAEGAEAAFAEGAEAAVAQGAEAAVAQGARGKWSWPGGSAIGTLGEFDVCYRVARSGSKFFLPRTQLKCLLR